MDLVNRSAGCVRGDRRFCEPRNPGMLPANGDGRWPVQWRHRLACRDSSFPSLKRWTTRHCVRVDSRAVPFSVRSARSEDVGQGLRAVRAGVPRVRVARRRRTEWFYKLNRLLLNLVMLSYVPLILACVGGMLYGGYSLTMALVRHWVAGVSVIWASVVIVVDLFVLGATLLLLFGLLPLFFREVHTLTPKHRLDLRQHPRYGAGRCPLPASVRTPPRVARWVQVENILHHVRRAWRRKAT